MNRFNLTAWAIAHRSIVYFLMAALVVVGISSYLRLGRNEDPTFTIKTMVVQAQWPGATLDDTLLQVTERIERKLQETPHLDYLKSYTKAGQSTVFVYLKGSTGPKEVSDTWYQVRKKVKDIELTLPPGVIGPVADDEFGDTYGIIYGFTADGFTNRQLRDYVEDIRSRLLQVPDVSKVNLIGAQPERIYIQFSPAKLAGYGSPSTSLAAALQAQNIVVPSGIITTEAENINLRVSGASNPRRTSSPSTSRSASGSSGWPTSPRCGGRTRIRPTRSSASTANPAWACRSRCAMVATCSRWARTSIRRWRS